MLATIIVCAFAKAQDETSFEKMVAEWPENYALAPMKLIGPFNGGQIPPYAARRLGNGKYALSLLAARAMTNASTVDGKPIKWVAVSSDYCVAVVSTADEQPLTAVQVTAAPSFKIGDMATSLDVPPSDKPAKARVGGVSTTTIRGVVALCDPTSSMWFVDGDFFDMGEYWGIVVQPSPRQNSTKDVSPFKIKFYVGDNIPTGRWRSVQQWQEVHSAGHVAKFATQFIASRYKLDYPGTHITWMLDPARSELCLTPDILVMLYETLRSRPDDQDIKDLSARTCIDFDADDSAERQKQITDAINAFAKSTPLRGLIMPENSGTIEEALVDAAGLIDSKAGPDEVAAALKPVFDVQPNHAYARTLLFNARIWQNPNATLDRAADVLAYNDTLESNLELARNLLLARRCDEAVAALDRILVPFALNEHANARAVELITESFSRCKDSRRRFTEFAEEALQRLPESPIMNWTVGRLLKGFGEARRALPLLLKAAEAFRRKEFTDYVRDLALQLRDQQAIDQLDQIK